MTVKDGYAEKMYTIFLDNNNRLLCANKISDDIENKVSVSKDVIVCKMLEYNAEKVLLVHDHRQDGTPSIEDIELTLQIKAAIEQFDSELAEHIIILDDCRQRSVLKYIKEHFGG